jgi:phage tail sheath protein FI
MKPILLLLACFAIIPCVTAQRNARNPNLKEVSGKQQIIKDIEAMVQSPGKVNNQITWTNVKKKINDYLIPKWKEGHLKGATPGQAFYVIADRTTMTQNDIDSGKLVVDVGLAFIKPAEFQIFRFEYKTRP